MPSANPNPLGSLIEDMEQLAEVIVAWEHAVKAATRHQADADEAGKMVDRFADRIIELKDRVHAVLDEVKVRKED